GRACCRRPGIEMPADHHDFIFQLRVSARNFGDGVEPVFMVAGEFRIDVEFDVHWNTGFQQSVDAAIVFNRRDSNGQGICVFALIDEPAESCAGVVKDGAAGAAAVSAIAARSDHCYCLLSSEKVSYFFAERESLEECRKGKV